jgi:hypothetical protein
MVEMTHLIDELTLSECLYARLRLSDLSVERHLDGWAPSPPDSSRSNGDFRLIEPPMSQAQQQWSVRASLIPRDVTKETATVELHLGLTSGNAPASGSCFHNISSRRKGTGDVTDCER